MYTLPTFRGNGLAKKYLTTVLMKVEKEELKEFGCTLLKVEHPCIKKWALIIRIVKWNYFYNSFSYRNKCYTNVRQIDICLVEIIYILRTCQFCNQKAK